MKVIFATHLCTREFMFKVPSHIKKIRKGELLAVHTMRGLALAIATTEIQDCSELIAQKLGAYLPLKEVYCIVTDELLRVAKSADEQDYGILPF